MEQMTEEQCRTADSSRCLRDIFLPSYRTIPYNRKDSLADQSLAYTMQGLQVGKKSRLAGFAHPADWD
jgi:hypothetical protein